MDFCIKLFTFLQTKTDVPDLYGGFHLLFLGLTVILTVWFAMMHRGKERRVRFVLLFISILLILLELYKQSVYNHFIVDGTVIFDYQWYIFPFQFCSTPMYVALLAGILGKGKLHDSLCAYLATYAIFAGAIVMLYPGIIFCATVGINIQSMICHGAMIFLGVYLLATGHVKLRHKTLLQGLFVFIALAAVAVIANEIAYRAGIMEFDTFNMFYFSPYCPPVLPVFSLVQNVLPFPICLFIYIVAFTLAAYIVLLLSIVIAHLFGGKNKEATLA